jgi:hypothetical protein
MATRRHLIQIAGRCLATLCCILLFASSIVLVYRHTVMSPHQLTWRAYGFSDLLIDYRAGFVRRGLAGEWLHRLSGHDTELPAANRLLFQNFCVLAITFTLLLVTSARRSFPTILLGLSIPGGIFAIAVSNEFFYRKEAFFYSALTITALAVAQLRRIHATIPRRIAAIFAISLIFVFGTALPLVHEGFFFLSAPASLLLLLAASEAMSLEPSTQFSKSFQRLTAWTYVVWEMFLLAVISRYHGTSDTAQQIWVSLNPTDRQIISPSGALSGGMHTISAPLSAVLSMSMHAFIDGLAWFWLVPLAGLMLYCLALVALNLNTAQESELSEWAVSYIFLAVCTSPMFIMGWDWGRWLASINLSFLILWLSIPASTLSHLSFRMFGRSLACEDHFPTAFELLRRYAALVRSRKPAFVMVLFVFAMTFRLPEGAMEPHDSEYVVHEAIAVTMHLLHRGSQ